jgi:hypothetical protein
VWLASVSLRDKRGQIVGTSNWTPRQWRYAEDVLKNYALRDAGDERRERMFRMCVTACLHRGIRDDELQLIDQWWFDADAVDLAGGPIEIIYSKGVADVESAKPCWNPRKQLIDLRRTDLYLPVDCGECPPCQARTSARTCTIPLKRPPVLP